MRFRILLLLTAGFGLLLPPARGQAPPRPPTHGGAPSVSPDGSKIAFLSDRDGSIDLYVISTDGTGEKRLTQKMEAVGRPDWSQDGKAIRFASFANDTSRIYTIETDGKNQKLLGSVPGRAATLSPDGTRVLYWTGTWTAVSLFVSGLDGSGKQQLTDGSSVAWNSRWSPDGQHIAFTGRDTQEVLHVYVLGADGTGLRQVTHFAGTDGQAQVPAWSPDGRQFAVQAGDRRLPGHIWIVEVATGAARKLNAHETYVDEVPCWFPDGKRIAFQSNRSGTMEVWVMKADGSAPHQVTH
jgi:Tol biopolymer transport system component